LHRLTRDHLYVVEKLGIAEAEARQHPEGHRLSRALDASQKELEVAWSELSLWPGGRFLLCTDGLTDVVADEEIHEALTSASPGEAVERLLQAAEREKTPDNATVIVVFVPEETPWSEAPREEREEALESASPEVAPWEQNPDEVETAPPPEVTDEVSPETAAPLETPPAANDHGLARLGQWVRSLVGKS
jgi:serine/threonine protein phosphatase PrpC